MIGHFFPVLEMNQSGNSLVDIATSTIKDPDWRSFFKLYFHVLFDQLDAGARKSYFADIRARYSTIIRQLSTPTYCQNCKSIFTDMHSLGCKQCYSHYGKLEMRGHDNIWSCCGIVHLPRPTTPAPLTYGATKISSSKKPSLTKTAENTHFPLGCRKSDHWDFTAIQNVTGQGVANGYVKHCDSIIIPFLVYMVMIYDKYVTKGPYEEIAEMFKSITKMAFSNVQRQEVLKSLNFRPGNSDNVDAEARRNYDPFFHTSLDDSFFSNPILNNFLPNGRSSQSVKDYIDLLHTQGGLLRLQKLIRNMTIPVTDDLFGQFLSQHLIMISKSHKEGKIGDVLSNYQSIDLIDLLTMNVHIARTREVPTQ